MNVGELIKELEKFDRDKIVVIELDNLSDNNIIVFEEDNLVILSD